MQIFFKKNSQIGRWFNPRTPNLNIGHYTKVTSILKGVESIQRKLDELLLRRKPQATELERLRAAYLTPAWNETNAAFAAFIVSLFNECLNGDADKRAALDAGWPRRDRFSIGVARIKEKHLPDLLAWVKKQEGTESGL